MDYSPLSHTQVQVIWVNPATTSLQYSVPAGWQDPSVLNAIEFGTNCCNGISVWGLMNSSYTGN